MLWLYLVVESLFGGAEVVPCCKGLSVLLLGQMRGGEQSSTEAQFVFCCLLQHAPSSGALLLKLSTKIQ